MQDTFEKNIKHRLQDHEMAPPPSAWANISKELEEEKPKVIPWARWSRYAAAILIPALLTVGFVWYNNTNSNAHNTQGVVNSNSETFENSGNRSGNDYENNTTQGIANHATNDHVLNTENSNSSESKEFTDYDNFFNNTTDGSNSVVNSVQKENRIVRFIKGVFGSDDDENLGSNNVYPNRDIANLNENEKRERANSLSALVAPFYTNPQPQMSAPDLYAYANSTNQELQITAFNAEEKKDKKTKKKSSRKMKNLKFEVSPFVGTGMLGSFDRSSLISPEFNQLSIDNELATTYGSKASYKINDRVKVRSGVGIVDITQNTYDVPMRITSNQNGLNYNLQSYTNAQVDLSNFGSFTNVLTSGETSNTEIFNQNISQEVQFIEVPMEVEYRLTDNKKLNIFTSGGLSTLVLNKNDVYIAAENKSLLAKPTNIKTVSFSANAGVKVDYKITEKVSVNVEPQFKFMINTITGNDEIQPYLVGVNAGVSYSL